MTRCRIAVAAALTLVVCACATAPTPRAIPTASAASVAPAVAVDTSMVRDAARRLGGVRPAFRSCVDAAAGVAAPTQACIGTEMLYQQGRLDAALALRKASASAAAVDTAQSQWLVERDRLCGADGPDVAIAKRLEAGVCRLEATAARADALSR